MAVLFPSNTEQVQAFAIALYGVELGSTYMGYVNNDITSGGGLTNALNNYYKASFSNTPATTVATTILTNLGLPTDAGSVALVAGVINGAAAGQQGAAVMSMLNTCLLYTSPSPRD